MTPFGRRVATFVGACLVFDLYGFAVYHAWRTHLLGAVPALVLPKGPAAEPQDLKGPSSTPPQ